MNSNHYWARDIQCNCARILARCW